ncbi:MAG: hypothetical protein BHV91_00085 [Clostridiales bacterium 44_9]|nr:MAG: hypothetical protein BHV91_00085 [Clostridiales bacterium 44_9]
MKVLCLLSFKKVGAQPFSKGWLFSFAVIIVVIDAALGALIVHYLDRGQHGADIEYSVAKERYAEQNGHHPDAFFGREDKRHAERTRDYCRREDTVQKNSSARAGFDTSTVPMRIISIPAARSYSNASLNRSFEKYPTSLTMPKAIIITPRTVPTVFMEISGLAIRITPSTRDSTDIAIYPIFATFIGAVERILIT